ncbi:alpha/beta fold hydrolase, partial [Nocardia gipuzkoensis]
MPMIDLSPGPIEYLVHAGDPGPSPLVFLHEGLGSAGMWGKLPRLLAARTGRTTVVYSRSGYGGSGPARLPREPGYMHTEARVLRELLGELEIDHPILIGHSDGASIAILYGGSAEVSADALVLIAPHVIVEEVTLAGIRTAVDGFADGSLARKLAQFHDDPDGL